MILFGGFCAAWLGFVYSAVMVHILPLSYQTAIVNGSIIIMLGILLYLFFYYSKVQKETYFNVICSFTVFFCCIGLSQKFGYDIIERTLSLTTLVGHESGTVMVSSVFGNNNFFAAWLAISCIMFFRPIWCFFIPVILYNLYLTHTMAADIALACGVFYYIPLLLKKYFSQQFINRVIYPALGLLLCVGLTYAITYHYNSFMQRIGFWQDAMATVFITPDIAIFGFGQGLLWQEGGQLHSEPFNILFNFGLFGISIMILYLIDQIMAKSGKILTACLIVCIVNSLANHLMHVVTTAILAISILAYNEKGRKNKWQGQ